MMSRSDVIETIRVAPALRTQQIVSNSAFQERRLTSSLHDPCIPLQMKLQHVYDTCGASLQPAEFRPGSHSSGMVPRANDQIVLLPCRGRCIAEMMNIVS